MKNEVEFKHMVRKNWLPDYWSQCLELKSEDGFPDVMFLNPETSHVTLVEFKYIREIKGSDFKIKWRHAQPPFAIEYSQAGGSIGIMLWCSGSAFWLTVEPTRLWLQAVTNWLPMDHRLLHPVDRKNIREFIQ